jgi:hypothetical protein
MKVRKDYIVAQGERANILLTEALIDKYIFRSYGSHQHGGQWGRAEDGTKSGQAI